MHPMHLALLVAAGVARADEPATLEPETKVSAQYPVDLMAQGLPPLSCVGKVELDRSGVPVQVVWTECPEGFRASATAAVLGWRWPVLDAPASTQVTVPFDLARAGAPLRIRKQVKLRYPKAAKGSALDVTQCKTRVFIDETGAPYAITYPDCPEMFRDAAWKALRRWRWYPRIVEGQAVKAQFVIRVAFTLWD